MNTKRADLFKGLEKRYLERVAPLCRGASYQEAARIFEEGDEAKELYVLRESQVALEIEVRPVPDRPAIPAAVEVVTKGEAFGWSALVEPHVYTSSVRCSSNCQVLAIRGDRLRRIMDDDPSLGYGLMRQLAKPIFVRLMYTRLRLTCGLRLVLLGKETGK